MRRAPFLRLFLLAALATRAGAACVNLDDVTAVKDLRVLSVTADKPGFLINLDTPDMVQDSDLQGVLTALIVDPKGNAQPVTFSAAGCPDYLDAISAASGQGTKICPAPSATSGLPAPIGPALMTIEILPTGAPGTATPANPSPGATSGPAAAAAVDIEYNPVLPSFGLNASQVGLFFSPTPSGIPQLDQAVQNNRDFGIDAIVNITFMLGTEQASVVKRIVYWPDLSAFMPGEVPNQNPTIDHLEFYKRRDGSYGLHDLPSLDPNDLVPIGTTPTVSIAAKDKLYVLPIPSAGAAETYPLRSRVFMSTDIQTALAHELLVFDFFTTAGTFSPAETRDIAPVFASAGAPIHLDSELALPAKATDIPASGQTDIWVVIHDERAGESWLHAVVNITP